jgi:hypothetical protein
VSALLAQAVAHCRVVPRPAFDGGEAGELLIRGRIRRSACELFFFGEDDQVAAGEHGEGAPLILSGELAQD